MQYVQKSRCALTLYHILLAGKVSSSGLFWVLRNPVTKSSVISQPPNHPISSIWCATASAVLRNKQARRLCSTIHACSNHSLTSTYLCLPVGACGGCMSVHFRATPKYLWWQQLTRHTVNFPRRMKFCYSTVYQYRLRAGLIPTIGNAWHCHLRSSFALCVIEYVRLGRRVMWV